MKDVNRHFIIRTYNYTLKKSQLVGYTGLVKLLGYGRAKRAIIAAYDSGLDKYTIKTRKGLKIDFYSK